MVHDGRRWRLHKGTYFVQFDWQTEGPAAGTPRYTKEQMNRVLRDLVASGGRVYAAMHKVTALIGFQEMRLTEAQLQDNGFIAGDEEYFWTEDGQEYDWIEEKWVLREAEETAPEANKMSQKDRENLERLEEKYPTRPNVRHMRTWAGPRHKDVAHDDEERLPANPTSSRFGNRGVKRKQDDGDGIGKAGNDGNPPVTGGNTKPLPKSKGGKPPPKKQRGNPGKQALFVVTVEVTKRYAAVAVPPTTMTTRGQSQTSKTQAKK